MSLYNFYRSKEFTTLRLNIIHERTNTDGFNICEHCNKPIIRRYDLIAHHVIELTEDNYTDASISLNPELIKLVHHRCHNKIHNKLGYSHRKVYLVHGSPLSGKTSYVNDVLNEGDLVIDIDSIWQSVSGQDRYVKPNRLRSCVFAVRDTLLDCVKYRRGKWLNAYIIGSYPLISDRERLCKELGAEEIHINTSYDECIKRLNTHADGRDVKEWTKYIDDYFRYSNNGG